MYCFTGIYKGKRISVMGSGMGVPSIGIYSYELFNMYDVDTIIRVGTCGAYSDKVHVRDIVVASGASSDSNYALQFNLNGTYSAIADFSLLEKCSNVCKKYQVKTHFGNVLTTDVFYNVNKDDYKKWAKLGILAGEMESYALYINAAYAKKKALTILSVSDSLVTNQETSASERETGFKTMMEIALETALEA
jgi:purine-nucleoside phosphorylase